ncbi:ribosome assembly RNA-binding protein YhbY [Myxococcus sp. SDU36]|uniref:ribosome assembly RNA-binding protein YhbY n=1 Tax=Myxococcus sp. SDU36 TaxID=2831967 RepID=UPI00254387D4|nr:ribosome assembly RNA-binding protein YhbY [Myxococcus sp. SDU36]WIG95146.1 ribosome assembly RNA-binding protein YhbY [Myxococcus sp. SDU36]
MPLTGKQRRHLRALGHHLEPVVIVGQAGVTEGVIAAIEQALQDHELIKVKINEGPETRQEAAARIAEGAQAELAQLLGRTALVFKKREKDSKFEKF